MYQAWGACFNPCRVFLKLVSILENSKCSNLWGWVVYIYYLIKPFKRLIYMQQMLKILV